MRTRLGVIYLGLWKLHVREYRVSDSFNNGPAFVYVTMALPMEWNHCLLLRSRFYHLGGENPQYEICEKNGEFHPLYRMLLNRNTCLVNAKYTCTEYKPLFVAFIAPGLDVKMMVA